MYIYIYIYIYIYKTVKPFKIFVCKRQNKTKNTFL